MRFLDTEGLDVPLVLGSTLSLSLHSFSFSFKGSFPHREEVELGGTVCCKNSPLRVVMALASHHGFVMELLGKVLNLHALLFPFAFATASNL
ncbi:hypothetical protein Tco_1569972 [Tanacetum coccineum]